MTRTAIPTPDEMEADKRRLETLLTVLPSCNHWPLGRYSLSCVRCATHLRADQLSDALLLLESHSMRRAS